MTPPPLTRLQLDLLLVIGCGDPTCTSHHEQEPLKEIFLLAHCHPKAGTKVCYLQGGIVRVTCIQCGKLIVNIGVAP